MLEGQYKEYSNERNEVLARLLKEVFDIISDEEKGFMKPNKEYGKLGLEMMFWVIISGIAKKEYEKLLKEVKRLPPNHVLRREFLELAKLKNSTWM